MGPLVLDKKIIEVFCTIYGHGSHLGHVCDQHPIKNNSFPCILKLTYKIWLKMAQLFLRKASFNLHICK